jgi:hypothetical protein
MHDHPGMKITALSIRHIDARSDVCEPRAYGEASVLRGRLRGTLRERTERSDVGERDRPSRTPSGGGAAVISPCLFRPRVFSAAFPAPRGCSPRPPGERREPRGAHESSFRAGRAFSRQRLFAHLWLAHRRAPVGGRDAARGNDPEGGPEDGHPQKPPDAAGGEAAQALVGSHAPQSRSARRRPRVSFGFSKVTRSCGSAPVRCADETAAPASRPSSGARRRTRPSDGPGIGEDLSA